jgi:hypothetical protein
MHRFIWRWYFISAREAMKMGKSPIIIDNTNTQVWEFKPYINLVGKTCLSQCIPVSVGLYYLLQRCTHFFYPLALQVKWMKKCTRNRPNIPEIKLYFLTKWKYFIFWRKQMCIAENFTRLVGRVFQPLRSTQQIIYSPWRAVEWNSTPLCNLCQFWQWNYFLWSGFSNWVSSITLFVVFGGFNQLY